MEPIQQPIQRTLGINLMDLVGRILKYVVEGGAVAIASWFFPRKDHRLTGQEVLMIALTATAVFAILDLFAPAVGLASRQGAGFGLGATLVGFPGISMGQATMPGVPAPPMGPPM